MSIVRLEQIIEPSIFTGYIANNTMEKTALVQAGVMTRNSAIEQQLKAGAHSFKISLWNDIGNVEANIINDNPDDHSTPHGITSTKQIVRKAFLHNSWGHAQFASEISGSNALERIQSRVAAYWERQLQRRLIATLAGVQADNLANNDGDMIHDISAETGDKAKFSAAAVIDAAGTLGDALQDVTGILMHGDLYRAALKADLIEFVKDSSGSLSLPVFRGLVVVQDDAMPVADGVYTSVLFGRGAIGFGMVAPRIASGTAIETIESAANGGGVEVLHNRFNIALAPHGYSFIDGVNVAGESPTIAELSNGAVWSRVVERKACPLAFLVSKL